MDRDFQSLDPKVAMDLHREFHQEMRNLREEEFKLADIYMKITTFAGGAVVLLLTRVQFSCWLALLVLATQASFFVLLWLFARRMKLNHEDYRLLGSWVMAIRNHHAESAFGRDSTSSFGQGGGMKRQLLSLFCCALAVAVMVCGTLALSYANALGPLGR